MAAARESRKPVWIKKIALSVAFGVGLATPVLAQEKGRPSGPREGIKVHGDWTIEVRNPDGSVASRHTFANALVAGQGDVTLVQLLGRTQPAFTWRVEVGDYSGAGSPCPPLRIYPDGSPCFVDEPGLTLTLQQGLLQLSGSVAARRTASVSRVATAILDPTRGPQTFSEKPLSTPIPVVAGQIIQITVVISFS